MSAPTFSKTHLVLIPSYNSGAIVLRTVEEVLAHWLPVWVVIDGSDDGTAELLEKMALEHSNLRVLRLARNHGKGYAVLQGAREAAADGYTHILAFDADGQHPARFIPRYMTLSKEHPSEMILGKPVFPGNAPWERVWGRKLCNFWANVETLGGGIGDTLFGMRIYPTDPFLKVMEGIRWARRYDFDTEIAVRMSWDGVETINVDTPVRYLTPEEGGISHFKYLRDNTLLIWMHLRLLLNFLVRWPGIVLRRRKKAELRALADPESEASQKQRIESVARNYVSPWVRSKVRRRLWGDPIFEAIADVLAYQEPALPTLEIGTGRGLLPFYLRARGIASPIRALAKQKRDVSNGNYIAKHAFDTEIAFAAANDLSREFSAFFGNVVLMDGLQRLTEEQQKERLVQAADAVAVGGFLILRELDSDREAWQARWAQTGELPGGLFSTMEEDMGNEGDYLFPTPEFIDQVLKDEGLTELDAPSEHLFVFTRL